MNKLAKIPLQPLLNGKFKFTPAGLLISEDVDFDDWQDVGVTLQKFDNAIQFAIGDWVNFGEHKFGEDHAQAIEETGHSRETVRKYAWVAQKVIIGNRFPELSFKHHMLVAPLDEEKQIYYLSLAESEAISSTKLAQIIRRDKKRPPTIIKENLPVNQIFHGDINTLHSKIPNDSIDMFFSDPLYHQDQTDRYYDLAQLASSKLKPGGLCLAYSGQMHLPQAMMAMSTWLNYWWTFAIRHNQGHLTIWKFNLWNDWKPIIVYAKPYADGSLPQAPDWVQDFMEGGGRDKRYHLFGQDASEITYWIEKLTEKDAVICDPYVGGGAIPVACKLTHRQWIGNDIDEQSVLTTRQRLEDIS